MKLRIKRVLQMLQVSTLLLTPGMSVAYELRVIGWNGEEESIQEISTDNYFKLIRGTEKELGVLVESELAGIPAYGRLRKISFGLGASAEVGIGPWKVGAGLRHRLYYTR